MKVHGALAAQRRSSSPKLKEEFFFLLLFRGRFSECVARERERGGGGGGVGVGWGVVRGRQAEEEAKRSGWSKRERKKGAPHRLVYRARSPDSSFSSSLHSTLSLPSQFIPLSHLPLLVLNSPHKRVGHQPGLVELVERVRRQGDARDSLRGVVRIDDFPSLVEAERRHGCSRFRAPSSKRRRARESSSSGAKGEKRRNGVEWISKE